MNQAVVFVVVVFAGGSLALAMKDPEFRPVFADLAKIGISGFFGSLIPSPFSSTSPRKRVKGGESG